MKFRAVYFIMGIVVTLVGCRKDEGLTEEQKSSFIKFYGVSATAVEMKQTSDGGYIILGNSTSGSPHIVLIKTNEYGNTQWSQSIYSPTDVDNISGEAIEVLDDGGFVIAGSVLERDSIYTGTDSANKIFVDQSRIFVTKTNGSGSGRIYAVIDEHSYPQLATYDAFGHGLTISNQGNFILACEFLNTTTGESEGIGIELSGQDLSMVGTIQGAINQGVTSNISFQDVVQSRSGDKFVFLGTTDHLDENEGKSVFITSVAAIRIEEGKPNNPFVGNPQTDEVGRKIIQNKAGQFVGCGYSEKTSADRDFFIFEAPNEISGEPIFKMTLDFENRIDEAYDIAETSDGYILVGGGEIEEKGRQMIILKVDKSGTELWHKDFGFVEFDEARSVITSDEKIIILGTASDDRRNTNICLIKTDENGELTEN